MCCWNEIYIWIDGTELGGQNKPLCLWSTDLQQGAKTLKGGKNSFSTDVGRTTGDLYAKE